VRWVLLDLLIALTALVGLGFVVLGLWRRVKELSREVGRAGESVGRATDALARAQDAAEPRRLGGPDNGGRRA
jgi:hypothetical protein